MNTHYFFPTFIPSSNQKSPKKCSPLSPEDLRIKFLPLRKCCRSPPTPLKVRRFNHIQQSVPANIQTFLSRFPNKTLIGRGSFWDVYRVVDTLDSKVKVLKISSRGEVRKNYEREFTINNIITDDTYIAKMFEVQSYAKMYYAVMDLYSQTILDVIITRVLTEDEILYCCWSVLHALRMLNRLGFVHLDVKPENIFITFDGKVKLGDFGTSRPIGSSCDIEEVGESRYLAPEVLQGIISPQSDIFSLGISLFEMSSRKHFPIYDKTFDITDENSMSFIRHRSVKDIFYFHDQFRLEE
ncbi:Membrane-associated tyrosine-and threonine-specific CDC2-inhibitory kinase [Entamoeba marina]